MENFVHPHEQNHQTTGHESTENGLTTHQSVQLSSVTKVFTTRFKPQASNIITLRCQLDPLLMFCCPVCKLKTQLKTQPQTLSDIESNIQTERHH